VTFSRSSSFDNIAVAIIEGPLQRIGSDRLIISSVVYREV
jgi:hypothetical protein